MLEVYPELIVQLNVEAFSHILGTLDFGLHHQVNCDSCQMMLILSQMSCRTAYLFYTSQVNYTVGLCCFPFRLLYPFVRISKWWTCV